MSTTRTPFRWSQRSPCTCFFLWCMGALLLLPLSNSLGMTPPEEEIETLDTIEITGAIIEQPERTLNFPIPHIRPLAHLNPTKNFSLPRLQLHTSIPTSSRILLDQTAKTISLHTPVKPLKTERPLYPRRAREQGWQGHVLVRLKVLANGTVESASIQKSSGHQLLDDNAINTARQWTFEPAKNGGFPVATTINIPIQFDLVE